MTGSLSLRRVNRCKPVRLGPGTGRDRQRAGVSSDAWSCPGQISRAGQDS